MKKDQFPQTVVKFKVKVKPSKLMNHRIPTDSSLGQFEVTEANVYDAPQLIFSFISMIFKLEKIRKLF